MYKWLLPTLSEVLAPSPENGAEDAVSQTRWKAATETDTQQPSKSRIALQRLKSEQEWCGARAALEDLLRSTVTPSHNGDADEPSPQGLILAGPGAVLSDSAVNSRFQTWIFSTQLVNPGVWMPFQLPPASLGDLKKHNYGNLLPLLPVDPLVAEQFCLILTASFSLVMVLGENPTYQPAFMFSFDPEVVQQAWISLRNRILLTCPHYINQLDGFSLQFPPTAPDYRTVMEFTRLLLKHLPQEEERRGDGEQRNTEAEEFQNVRLSQSSIPDSRSLKSDDVELLQAFAHEVRTPLTTIRTLTRLLLRRKDLATDVIKRLEIIDRECTEQIDRMELLFQAAELQTSTKETHPIHLTPVSLAQVFQESLPRWEKQASRRNQTLDAILPQHMPQVVSDPTMLDRVLTGLIDNFARNLPAGSHIQVEVMPAGDRLKLRLQPHSGVTSECENTLVSQAADTQLTRKSIGQLLIFQPETGSLSLNHTVTKNLFQALGGKLIVRQRPQQGEVLTIFLPLEPTTTDIRWERESYEKKPMQ